MEPPGPIRRAACFMVRTLPTRLTSSTRVHSAISMSTMAELEPIPALAKAMSRPAELVHGQRRQRLDVRLLGHVAAKPVRIPLAELRLRTDSRAWSLTSLTTTTIPSPNKPARGHASLMPGRPSTCDQGNLPLDRARSYRVRH